MSRDSDEELADRLKQIGARLLPSDVIRGFREYEADSFKQFTGPDYGGLVDIFDMCFTVLTRQINTVSFVAQEDWPNHRPVQFVTLAHNVKPFYSVFNLVSHGFADDAIILLRPLFETIIRVVYMSCYSDEPYAALVHKPPSGIRQFQLTNFVENELKLDWLAEYGVVSSFTHSNSHLTLKYAVAFGDTGKAPLSIVSPRPTQDYTEIVTNSVTFYLYCYMQIVRRVFTVDSSVMNQEQEELWDAASQLEDILRQILVEHPNPSGRFRNLATDADNLIELILQADSGKDWKTAWEQVNAS